MSFSSELKENIITSASRSSCCKRAFLEGIISAAGSFFEDGILVRIEGEAFASYTAELIREIFGKEPRGITSPNGGRGKKLYFTSPAALKYLTALRESGAMSPHIKCADCQASFLRGAFFARGRMGDVSKGFSLEFSFGESSGAFLDFFSELGLEIKRYERRGEVILYTKNSTVMENFFGECLMQDTMFEIINVKIKNGFLNNANRHRNIDTGNIAKAVNAATEQTEVLKKLRDKDLLASLPPELEAMARLRLEYPDKSLSQLAIVSVPEITKSGINHRMRRLMALAREILSNYGE